MSLCRFNFFKKVLFLLLVPAFLFAGDSYFCPMKCEKEKIYVKQGRCPVCHMKLDKVGAGGRKGMQIPEVRVDLNVTPAPKPKVPATLLFSIRNTKDNSVVKELEVVHEKPFHLIMVSQDLSWYAHEHPAVTANGDLKLDFTFPEAGNYVLYGDFKPKDKTAEVIPMALRVEGEAPKAVALNVDNLKLPKRVDGYEVKLTTTPTLQHGDQVKLAFSVTQNKKPVTDIETYLGAGGHLVGVSEDTTRYLHAHPADHVVHEAGGHGQGHAQHHAAPTAKNGPNLEFATTFPRDGLYKLWLQFQHAGKVHTVPFVVTVR